MLDFNTYPAYAMEVICTISARFPGTSGSKFHLKQVYDISSKFGMNRLSKLNRRWTERIPVRFADTPFTRNRGVVLACRVSREMIGDDATHLAAGISYFAIFSLFPILLGSLAIAGVVLDSEEVKKEFLQYVARSLPGTEQFIDSIVPTVERNVESLVAFSGPLGIISAVGLL